MTITRYLSRLLMVRFLTALLALAGLAGLLDLIDNAGSVLDRRGVATDLFIYFGLRLPNLFISVLPLATLIAALFTFMGLALHQEIVALRAAGVTFIRLASATLPAAALIGLLYCALWNYAAPHADIALNGWLGEPGNEADSKPQTYWIRLGSDLVSFEDVAAQGSSLSNVTIYERADDSKLTRWRKAAHATYLKSDIWRLNRVQTITADGGGTQSEDTFFWHTRLRPQDTLLAAIPASQGSLAQPRHSKSLGWIGAYSRAHYATRAEVAIAIVFVPLVMVILTLPVATLAGRGGGVARRLALVLIAGLSYVLANGLLRTLGETGALPPFIAAWGATLVFLLAGVTAILYIED